VTDSERRRRIEEVCDAALDREAAERAAFVAAECGSDESLRQEVEALLAHISAADKFLAVPIDAIAAHILDEVSEATSGAPNRIEELYETVLALPPDAREAFLKNACDGDQLLQRELELLLDEAPSFARPSAPTPAAPDLTGAILGHYKIISLLGRGGMGEVFLAEDVRLGRRVALKVLPLDRHDAGRAERFLREARAASALNHPNIVTIHDIGESDAGRFIAMEFIPGGNLRMLIARRPPVEETARVMAQAARALASAHAAGIIHRDIKPENIMLRDDGCVKVVDFGLARAPDVLQDGASAANGIGLTLSGQVVGTYKYMSPEQSVADPLTVATDVYSLGVVLYELLTGRRPIEAPSVISHLAALASRDALAPSLCAPEIPALLDALALQMLDRNAVHRPMAEEVASRLEAFFTQRSGSYVRATSPRRIGVGRETERRALHAALARVGEGRSRMLLVAGDAGVGKTTLIDDFLAELLADDPHALVARGRCSERLAGTGGYLPIFEALHQFMGRSADTVAARLVKSLAPNWYEQIMSATELVEPRTLSPLPPAPPERMKREIVALLQEAARERPLVLCLEDLHWVDTSTLDVLAYVLDRPDDLHVLVLGTYRPTEISPKHPFVDLRLDVMTRGLCDEVQLGALERRDIDSYLALAFPGHRLPTDFADLVYRRTEGHALFMVDLIRYLRDRGAVAQRDGAWVVVEPLAAIANAVPQSVQSMVDRKLEQLSEDDRRLLVVASVQGDEFDAAIVAAATGRDPATIEEQLEPLERSRGIVRLTGEQEFPNGTLTARYRFVHALYQNELYGDLRPARRAGLSHKVADALIGLHSPHTDRIAAQLGFLFEAARDFQTAADHFRIASDRAQRIGAMHEAEALGRRGVAALSNLPDTPDRQRRELALQVAMAVPSVAIHTHAAPETLAVFGRIQQLGKQTGDVQPLFAMLDRRAWGGLSAGDTVNAHAAAVECLTLATGSNDSGARIVAHFLVAVTGAQLAEFAGACSHHESIRTLYEPRLHHVPLSYLFASDLAIQSRSEHADLLFHTGRFAHAFALADEAVALGRELGPPLTTSIVLLRKLKLLMESRDAAVLPEAEELLAALHALWAQHQLMHSNWGPYYRGWIAAVKGDVEGGTAEMQRGIAALRALGFRYYGPTMTAAIADLWSQAGRADDALRLVDEMLIEARAISELHIVPELLRIRGMALWKRCSSGTTGAVEGEATVRKAMALAHEHGSWFWELRAANTLALGLIEQDRRQDALPILQSLAERFATEPPRDLKDLATMRALLQSAGGSHPGGAAWVS
jgi:serine/threonine protein kinase